MGLAAARIRAHQIYFTAALLLSYHYHKSFIKIFFSERSFTSCLTSLL